MITKEHEESFGSDVFTVLLRVVVLWIYKYIVSMHILFVNYISINLLKQKAS